ncbi:TPA: hypothetical protein PF714_002614 [Staphylococcus aureus]|uniref:hypothetical protein n=1 Tax=Staphylococcus aureus TaxID=1280 RepID=UPI00139CC2B4|nr:hypothetical protein [Staphylococcus aureus]NDP30627.1 hypothetical protein [Staphylococcus aureus]NDP32231.1 hypothetical protein [Staphylococcus aureus]NDP96221.1 hypothetical protein [Staphylococcus aureus]NDQ09298.1 hypothetical protein [Staphylococcus aureus]NDQ17934.1 hypothetical protein [Staphylococcus aureus]
MTEKDLLNILLDISRQKDAFTYLEDNDSNDDSLENLRKILETLLSENIISAISNVYASNQNYLILKPNNYELTSEGKNRLK